MYAKTRLISLAGIFLLTLLLGGCYSTSVTARESNVFDEIYDFDEVEDDDGYFYEEDAFPITTVRRYHHWYEYYPVDLYMTYPYDPYVWYDPYDFWWEPSRITISFGRPRPVYFHFSLG